MYNALLDRLPEDYKGWLIRTDYRIGVQIQLCVSDPELSESERTFTALSLLYGNGIPDLDTAIEGLSWFMSCGNPEEGGGEDAPCGGHEIYSFEYDAARVVSAFRKVFGIDITREKMHWFAFVPMLGDLAGTAFTSVIDIRSTDASEVDKRKRSEFLRMKKRYSIPTQHTREEEAALNEFMARLSENL